APAPSPLCTPPAPPFGCATRRIAPAEPAGDDGSEREWRRVVGECRDVYHVALAFGPPEKSRDDRWSCQQSDRAPDTDRDHADRKEVEHALQRRGEQEAEHQARE